jgi:hypothetical protein
VLQVGHLPELNVDNHTYKEMYNYMDRQNMGADILENISPVFRPDINFSWNRSYKECHT